MYQLAPHPDARADQATAISLLINAICSEDRDDLHPEDRDVPGWYRVDLDWTAANGRPRPVLASMALDVFHSTVPVAVLEDFTFIVFSLDGKQAVDPDPAHEYYSASDAGVSYKLQSAPS